MTDLPSGVQALVDRVSAQGHDSPTYLDPGREDEREAIEYFLDRSGKSASRYPALHAALAGGEVAVPGAPLDRCTLVDAGKTEDGAATARTWVASEGGAFVSGAHTLLVDREGSVLASGSHTQVGGGLVRNATAGDAAAAAPEMTGVSFFHAQRSPAEPVRFGLAAKILGEEEVPLWMEVREPRKIRSRKPDRIVIGIARQQEWPNTDCDYVYPEAVNVEPDRLVVPCSGEAEFEQRLRFPPESVSTLLWCDRMPLNGWQRLPELQAGFRQLNDNSVAWGFPFDDQPISRTKSLQYDPLRAADENVSYFYFRFELLGDNGRMQVATICSADWPGKPSAGCTMIDNLEYWWHCLDAEAEVTLADGSRMRLIEIDRRSEVRLLDGSSALVEATTLDIHDLDNDDPVMRLETEGGRSLILTAPHPLFVDGAPVAARDLEPGDEIAVEGGVDRVTSCRPHPQYEGLLGNLQLAGSEHAFFANRIGVGDFSAVSHHLHKTRHDPDYMLPRLPESHHQDFLSALADTTAR